MRAQPDGPDQRAISPGGIARSAPPASRHPSIELSLRRSVVLDVLFISGLAAGLASTGWMAFGTLYGGALLSVAILIWVFACEYRRRGQMRALDKLTIDGDGRFSICDAAGLCNPVVMTSASYLPWAAFISLGRNGDAPRLRIGVAPGNCRDDDLRRLRRWLRHGA